MSRRLSLLKRPKKSAPAHKPPVRPAPHHASSSAPTPSHPAPNPPASKPTREDLINAESAVGRTLFGPIPAGHRREFFQHKKNLWLWHESWTDEKGKYQELTVRYEVRPSGVFKKPLGGKYHQLKGAELENFRRAVHAYARVVKQELY